jgi:glycosyltransferase involved in cell wall biosynthesis
MKVLLATYQSAFFCPGGGEQQFLKTDEALKNCGCDVELFDYHNSETIKDSNIINQTFECRYINLGTSRTVDEIGKNPSVKVLRYISILWQVITQLIKFKPSLCYIAITAKGSAFYKDSIVAILAKLFRVKVVYHFHNKGVSLRQDMWFDNWLYKQVFKNTEVILLSEYLYLDIQKYVPKDRVYYCPNGIPNVEVNIQKSKVNGQKKTINILFLSNLFESKGVFVLLEACKILKEKQLPFHCTFAGGEGDVNALQLKEKALELGLENQAIYVGKKYGNEKSRAFSVADIFAFPTYYECFPLVILEAMQYKLPVVSTFEGGIPDIVEDGVTGYLVPQKDANALAEKLEILIKNLELRIKMGKAGRKKYEENFTLEIFEKRLTSILKEIVHE